MRALAILLLVVLLAPAVAARDAARLAFAVRAEDTLYEGDLAPGRAVVYEIPMRAPNLTGASFVLDWDAPPLGSSPLTLAVEPPAGARGGSVEASRAPLRLDAAGLPPVPESDVVPASQLAARLALAETHGGEGTWRVSLRAASGVLPTHYRLDVRWLRYEAVVLTAATGPGGAGVPVGDLAWVGGAALVGLAGCSLAVAAFVSRGRTKPDLALPEGDNRPSWER